MAENLNQAANESANREHNVAARKEQIGNAFNRLYAIDKEIDALIERHVQELRDEKSDIKKKLRKDLNLTSKVVHLRYASYKAERLAVEQEDGVTMDAIKELYEVMPVGATVDFVDAMNGADEAA